MTVVAVHRRRTEPVRRPVARARVRDRNNRDRGSVTIQYVILIPAMFLLIFTCVQVALYSYARSVALTAAQEGVTAQRVFGAAAGAGSAQAHAFVKRQGDTLSKINISVIVVGDEVVATVTGYTQSVLPGFGGYFVSQTARGTIEEFHR